jgi:hypothetical protein
MFHVRKLDSRSESKNRYTDTQTYYISYQGAPAPLFSMDVSATEIIVGVLEKYGHAILKRSSQNTLRKEYTIGESLKHIPGFMNAYCCFQCGDTEIRIMPYLPLGSVRLHVWKEDMYACLRSCLLQIVASLFQAYEMHGFIHNAMHLDNVLLKQTKRIDSIYTLHGKTVVIPTHGYRISIMDFEQSLQDTLPTKGQGLIFLYKDIQHAIEDLNYASNICIEHMQELTNTLMDLQNIPFRDWDSYATFQRLQSSIKTLRFLPKPTLSFYTDGYLESG